MTATQDSQTARRLNQRIESRRTVLPAKAEEASPCLSSPSGLGPLSSLASSGQDSRAVSHAMACPSVSAASDRHSPDARRAVKQPLTDEKRALRSSHLFTVRVWQEGLGGGRAEWRGQVRHVASGETSYFRDWPTLVSLLIKMLSHQEDEVGQTASQP